ncbi:MAG: hypothetical protein LBB67_07870 [Oscillospiraceae bacterium]|nr:hypothetical protein [Oscillospiraceae bacterium]
MKMKNILGGIVIALVIFALLMIKAVFIFIKSHPLMALIGIAILVAVVLYRDEKVRERAEQREEWASPPYESSPRAEAKRIADAVVRERAEEKHITDAIYKATNRAYARAEAKEAEHTDPCDFAIDRTAARARIIELRDQIRHHEEVYYVKNRREISDKEFDALFSELEELEAMHPVLITANSPSQRPGGRTAFNPIKLKGKQMLGIRKARTLEDLREFCEELKCLYGSETFTVEQKVYGLSAQLEYQDGKLVLGYTRALGGVGEDVTQNLRCIPDIPNAISYKIPAHGRLVVRGEVYMTHQTAIDTGYSDPRIGASMTLHQRVDCKKANQLHFMAFDLVEYQHMQQLRPELFESRANCLILMREIGFQRVPFVEANGYEEVLKSIEMVREYSEGLDYDIDGVVVKANNLATCQSLGDSKAYPRWAMAWK